MTTETAGRYVATTGSADTGYGLDSTSRLPTTSRPRFGAELLDRVEQEVTTDRNLARGYTQRSGE
jgi:hypothetical protein